MGFTKLDEDILKSSIMAADSDTFKVWIALLAACRENGIAAVSEVFLSAVCHLEMPKIEAAIKFLSSPDEHSRTKENDGRRIKRVDGGILILNYQTYREKFHYSGKPESERKRAYRKRVRDMSGTCPETSGTFRDVYASAFASGKLKISLNTESEAFENIPETKVAKWAEAYPAVDVQRAIKRCAAYFIANPAKRKLNWERTINNWLKRDQERGGDIGPGRRPPDKVGAHPPRNITDEERASYRRSAEKETRNYYRRAGLEGETLEARVAKSMEEWDRNNPKGGR